MRKLTALGLAMMLFLGLAVIDDFSVVALSNDGPFSWQILYQQDELSFRGISAVNESVCWVSGSKGTILRTTDGGETWESLTIPGTEELDFRDIEAFDAQRAVVMSAGSGSAANVYKTTDGGKTWKHVLENEFEEGFFNGIAFWDEQRGVLAGDPVGGHLFIMTTTDGGNTWERVPTANIPLQKEGEWGFAASGTHVTVSDNGNAWVGTGGSFARVMHSTDYGKTWSVAPTPIIQGESTMGIFSLVFKDPMTGIAVGGDYTKEQEGKDNIIKSTDGGETWNLISEANLDFRSCIRFTEGTFFTVGPSGSEFSTDGGTTWETIEGPGFHTLSIGSGGFDAIWAAGAEGRIGKLINQ